MADGSSPDIGPIPTQKTPDYVKATGNNQAVEKSTTRSTGVGSLSFPRRAAVAAAGVLGILSAPGIGRQHNPTPDTATGYQPNAPTQTNKPQENNPATPEQHNQNSWQVKMAQELDGTLPLQPGETLTNGARIISLGDGKIGVNIRPFASNRIGPGLNQDLEDVPVLAILKSGAQINGRTIEVKGSFYDNSGKHDVQYGVFRAKDIQGELVDPNGNPVHLDPEMVVAAAEPYFQPQPAQQGNAE
jgi:hypothetical protein